MIMNWDGCGLGGRTTEGRMLNPCLCSRVHVNGYCPWLTGVVVQKWKALCKFCLFSTCHICQIYNARKPILLPGGGSQETVKTKDMGECIGAIIGEVSLSVSYSTGHWPTTVRKHPISTILHTLGSTCRVWRQW